MVARNLASALMALYMVQQREMKNPSEGVGGACRLWKDISILTPVPRKSVSKTILSHRLHFAHWQKWTAQQSVTSLEVDIICSECMMAEPRAKVWSSAKDCVEVE